MYAFIDVLKIENIIILTLLILTMIYLLSSLIKNYQYKYKIVLDKLLELPIPLCIINLSNNKIVDGNQPLKDLFNVNKIKNTDISGLNIFSKFETYLDIKNICKHSESKNHSRIISIDNNNSRLFFRVDFTYITIGYKKFMLLTLINNTDMINYIKKIGVLANVVDKSSEGIIVSRYENEYDEYPKILYVNSTLKDITGYNADEAINKPVSALFETNIDENTLIQLKTNLRELKPTTLEYQYTKKNGQICWIISEIVPITKRNIFSSLVCLDDNRCLDNLYENDISDIDIYITLYQKDITIMKDMGSIPKVYSEKLSNMLKCKETYVEMIGSILNLYNEYFKYIPTSRDDVLEILTPLLGKALNSDRCYISSIYDKDGKKYIHNLSVWYKDENMKNKLESNFKLLDNTTFEDISAYQTYSHMISNKVFKLNIKKIKVGSSLQVLEANGIKSSLRCPIYKDNNLIGMISADDFNDNNREWNNSEKLIRTVADNITNII